MNRLSNCVSLLAFLVWFSGCANKDPNITSSGKDEFQSHELSKPIDQNQIQYEDIIYVPIYSDVYVDGSNPRNLLAATLSIRNTSYSDTLFISKIDYYNTAGTLVRNYIPNPISLAPMGTINYVIEREDDAGGSGANFIVELSAKNDKVRPLIQAVMLADYGNKAFSFLTDGYSVKE
ncbi:MAG: DUF3124 domain-containing protein [Saprospiraceae bacterium]